MVIWTLRRFISLGKAFDIMPNSGLVIHYKMVRFYQYLVEMRMTEHVPSQRVQISSRSLHG